MSNTIFLDTRVSKNCKNFYDSYGMICVGCNCCGRFDPKTMILAAAKLLMEVSK